MLNVSQVWKDNQKKAFQSEADVKLDIYSKGFTQATFKVSLNKRQLTSFNYEESGSIINDVLQDVEISFGIVKNNIAQYMLAKTDLIVLSYGFKLNGSWEYVIKGVYEITEISIKENDMTAKYVAKQINYKVWQQIYTGGSANLNMNGYGGYNNHRFYYFINTRCFKPVFENTNGDFSREYGKFVFDYDNLPAKIFDESYQLYYMSVRCGSIKYVEVAQLLAQYFGSTFQIKGEIDTNNYYTTTLKFSKIDNSYIVRAIKNNKVVILDNINFIAFPEIIDEKQYKILHFKSYKWQYNADQTYTTSRANTKQILKIASGTSTQRIDSGFVIGATANANVSNAVAQGTYFTATASTDTDFEIWLSDDTLNTTDYTINNNNEDEMTFTSQFGNFKGWASNYLVDWLSKPYTYTYQMRIDPSIELYDVVFDPNKNEYFIVVGISLTYNGGGFNGSLKLKNVGYSKINKAPIYGGYINNSSVSRIIIENQNSEEVNCAFLIGDSPAVWNGIAYDQYYLTDTISANTTKDILTRSSWNSSLNYAYGDYINNQLKEDVYAYFYNALGEISEPTLIWRKQIIEDPVVSNLTWTNSTFSFDVYNPNNESVNLFINYPNGTIQLTVEAGKTLNVNNSNASALQNVFRDHDDFHLNNNVYCYFETVVDSIPSGQTTILSANNTIEAPIIEHLDDDPSNYYFEIENHNNAPVKVIISYSGDTGTYEFLIPASERISINSTNAPNLYNDFVAFGDRQLTDNLYCWFENNSGDVISSDTIILEANEIVNPVITNLNVSLNYSFTVVNNNDYDVYCDFYDSSDNCFYSVLINANSSWYCDYQETSNVFRSYFELYLQNSLPFDFGCVFSDPETGNDSGFTVILEENDY